MNKSNTKVPLLSAVNLTKTFQIRKKKLGKSDLKAVSELNLTIFEGEAVGLLGESGSGKSTIGNLILRLIDSDSGDLIYKGKNITRSREAVLRKTFRKDVAMVFQNPGTSLSPHLRIGDILEEPLIIARKGNKKERLGFVKDAIKNAGLSTDVIDRYSSELSGGQRQRVGIARALMLNPSLIVADEPTASLDVSVQAQILNLLKDLKEALGISFLFITHDLAVARYFCDRIVVLYSGEVMEIGPADMLSGAPQHPYTEILRATSSNSTTDAKLIGSPTSPIEKVQGCVFRTRCPIAKEICSEIKPPLSGNGNSYVACHFPGEYRADLVRTAVKKDMEKN